MRSGGVAMSGLEGLLCLANLDYEAAGHAGVDVRPEDRLTQRSQAFTDSHSLPSDRAGRRPQDGAAEGGTGRDELTASEGVRVGAVFRRLCISGHGRDSTATVGAQHWRWTNCSPCSCRPATAGNRERAPRPTDYARPMRFHTPALPGRPVTRENSRCAFTQKVRNFKPMMEALGHEVIVYGRGADVECDPFDEPPPFDANAWKPFNDLVKAAIYERAEPGDILGLMAGTCQEPLAEAFPEMLPCEYGIGYAGCFASFKVFESYAWMHTVYGRDLGAETATGSFFDAVIPGYFNIVEFPEHGSGGDDYLVYVGRMIERKGPHIAAEVAERLGMPLYLAGEGDYVPEYGEFLGPLGPDERSELIAGARALLAPTLYVEPFGNTAVEAQLCGTPAITTDWGAFTETVEHGVSGFRCHTLAEFIEAVEEAPSLDHDHIRAQAQSMWSMEVIGPRYDAYFRRLELLRGEGWYAGATLA